MPKESRPTQCHGALPAPCFLCSLGSLIWSEFIFVLVVTWLYGYCWGIVHYRLNVNDFRYAPTGAWKSLRPMGKWGGWETMSTHLDRPQCPPTRSYSPPPQQGRRASVHTFSLSKGLQGVSWRILRSLLGAAAGSLMHTSKTFFCHYTQEWQRCSQDKNWSLLDGYIWNNTYTCPCQLEGTSSLKACACFWTSGKQQAPNRCLLN